MFLQIFFVVVGSREVFKGSTTPLMAGFLMGTSAMLSELFFVLMCVFFTYGTVAASAGVGQSLPAPVPIDPFVLNLVMSLRL
jgi:hypothetical protein